MINEPDSPPANDSPRRRRWIRFSLASMLVAVLITSLLCWHFEPILRDYLRDRGRYVPTGFDFASGKNILWSAKLGSVCWGEPVVYDGKIYVGTNNAAGYLPRYPPSVDLGVLLCFDAADGSFLWQASHPKLPSGRVNDWPMQGVTNSPTVEADRLWYVNNRAEVVCLDTAGFLDEEDDGIADDLADETNKRTEADTVWRFDMMSELDVFPHNASCSNVAVSRSAVFVVTGNGVDQSHLDIPSPQAPSFLALDKTTGRLLWSDNSPGQNILHAQWGSPTYAVIGGTPQVLFPGGDGWLYSFDPAGDGQGNSKLLWKFDCNPKDSEWILGGRGTRNNLVMAPTVAGGLVYITMGQDPEHGEGSGRIWCINPNQRGDVSPELVFASDGLTPAAHRRPIAVDKSKGEIVKANPNSAVVWCYRGNNLDGNGVLEYKEEMHRSVSKVVVQDGIAMVTDYSGFVHCLDAKTGQGHWMHDLLALCWASPVISVDHVYVTDEDGGVTVFKLSADPAVAKPGGNPVAENNLPWSTRTRPAIANNTLYIVADKQIIAIAEPPQ